MELSRKLSVKPLNLGEVKIFKLINAGKPDPAVRDADGKPVVAYNQGATYVGEFNIFDIGETDKPKANKTLRNITGRINTVSEGREYVKEIVSDIVFNRQGICIVNHAEPNKLICLSRANENASNPYREKRVTALWEEMSVAETRKVEIQLANLVYEAETIAMTGDIKDVMAICEKITPPISVKNKESGDIRHDLRMFAKTNAREVIRNSKNQESKVRILLEDALHLRVLSFLDENRTWIWESDESEIVKVEAGKNPEETLIEYILKTKEVGRKLQAALKPGVEVEV